MKITIPVLALNVPPLLLHALSAPEIVMMEVVVEFKIPPLSIVIVPTEVLSIGNVGSLGVVEASGSIIFAISDGIPLGVQFFGLIHSVLIKPFHVETMISELASVSNAWPKTEGYKDMGMLVIPIQLFVRS